MACEAIGLFKYVVEVKTRRPTNLTSVVAWDVSIVNRHIRDCSQLHDILVHPTVEHTPSIPHLISYIHVSQVQTWYMTSKHMPHISSQDDDPNISHAFSKPIPKRPTRAPKPAHATESKATNQTGVALPLALILTTLPDLLSSGPPLCRNFLTSLSRRRRSSCSACT